MTSSVPDGDLSQGDFIASCNEDALQDRIESWDRSLILAFQDKDGERAHTRIALSHGFHADPGATPGV